MSVAVISSIGKKLMPTSNHRARKLLKAGRAEIYKYRPIFTIRMLDKEDGDTQPIEYSCDTGKMHVGVSIKTEKQELVSATYNMLPDEKERHDACRKYRRTRRNRKRYRKPRLNNRSKQNKQFAPSIRHIEENQLRLFEQYHEVMPITAATFEMGLFDTAQLVAIEEGRTLQSKDYQYGYRYQMQTLRKAVMFRDNYTCQLCGKSIKDGAILCIHHLGYRKHDHSNRMGNLTTLCTDCHTSKNHQPGGKLYDWHPKVKNLSGAAYMNTVRWDLHRKLVMSYPDVGIHVQYGAKTAEYRHERHFRKDRNDLRNHALDAYCIGRFHPKRRAYTVIANKKRRNNRVLSKFYDAKYIDVRDGKKKSGTQLSCGRTNRREARNTIKNERIYRCKKKSKGRVSVRRRHYSYQPSDLVEYDKQRFIVKGVQNCGQYTSLQGHKPVKTSELRSIRKQQGWQFIPA